MLPVGIEHITIINSDLQTAIFTKMFSTSVLIENFESSDLQKY